VIGILDQPVNGKDGKAYLAASYVKYLEGSGALVVPISYNSTTDRLNYLFPRLNGILFTGGGTDLRPGARYYETGKTLYTLAINANKRGDYFPIWGTCMGFQFLTILAAEDPAVLGTGFDSYNFPIPLNFTQLASTSRLFSEAGPSLMTAYATLPITMNNHHDGVLPETYVNNAKLSAFFNVLSTNVDRKGRLFASTIEAKAFPIFAAQWHPEKNNYEWTTAERIPHTGVAVRASQYPANFFVDECRKSGHTVTEQELQPLLIYNYQPVFTGAQGSDFTQQYNDPT